MIKTTQIAFVRHHQALEQLAVIQFTHEFTLHEGQAGTDAVMAAFQRVITKWVETTPAGKEAWDYSVEDLNIGDMLSIEDPALDALLLEVGIQKWECIFQLSNGSEVSYDRVLASPKEAPEDETEE